MNRISHFSVLFWTMLGLMLSFAPPVSLGIDQKGMELLGHSGDAFVRQSGNRWEFGTSKVDKGLILKDGHLSLISFKNPAAHRDYVQGDSEAFGFSLDNSPVTAQSRLWKLTKAQADTLAQGELLFTFVVQDDSVKVSLYYLIYPDTSIIQEWLAIENLSGKQVVLKDPYFLQTHVLQKEVPQLDFSYMTGGMGFWGSSILKTALLTAGYARNFASNDPPECLPGQDCPKDGSMGNSVYAPIYVFFNRKTKVVNLPVTMYGSVEAFKQRGEHVA